MNLIKYFGALLMLALLSACGGGGGSAGTSSGASTVIPLFTSAPASLTLASGTTSVSYDVSGGVAPYSASPDTPALISVSLNGSSFTIAAAAGNSGSGAVVVTDSKGTKVSILVTVPAPTAMFSTAPASLTLPIGASSSAYPVTGGTGPYAAVSTSPGVVSASIPTGSNFLTITALPGTSGGAANVIVSDTKGAQLTIAVTVPVPATLFSTAPANLTLAIGASSSAYPVTGGTGPYSAVSTNQSLVSASIPTGTNLLTISALPGTTGGTANVIVSDSKGTQLTIAVTVPAPATLFSTAPANLTLAIGATSSAYSITGGIGAYTAVSTNQALVSASIPIGTNLLTISALPGTTGGTANVIVSDSKGTQLTIAVTVSPPATLFSTAPANLTLAIGATSSAYSVTGGIGAYTAVSTNQALVSASIPIGTNLLTISALPGTTGGTANVIVSDSKGNQLTIAVTVPTPVGLYVDAPANLTIGVGAPGNTYTISGGTGPYTAVSSNAAVVTSTAPASNGKFVIQGVSVGNASVTVKDALGIAITISVTVPAPTALFSTAPSTLQILSGTTNFYTVFGGTAPYVVNTPPDTNGVIVKAVLSGTSLAISGLLIGHQTVAVSDAKGAVITIDVTVNQGMYTDAPANLSIARGTGATYSIYGGVPYSGVALYRVNSSNPSVASATVTGSILSISGLSVGSTTLVISDSLGATTLITVTVPAAGALMSTAPSSLKLATGTSFVYVVTGGVGPYTATSANPAIVSASASGTSLTIGAVADTIGGTANVIVTDSAGTAPLTISVTAAPVQFFTTAPSSLTIAAGDPKIFAVFGGTSPYSVVNTNPSIVAGSISGSTLSITGSMAGSGTVILSDLKGVTISIAVTVTASGPALFVDAPLNLTISSVAPGNTYPVTISGGTKPYSALSSNVAVATASVPGSDGKFTITALSTGNATITIKDATGTPAITISVTVPAPNVLFTDTPSNLTLAVGSTNFTKIYGGTGTYSVNNSNPAVVTTTLTGSSLSIVAKAVGVATVAISDTSGSNPPVLITVTVPLPSSVFSDAPANLTLAKGAGAMYTIYGGIPLTTTTPTAAKYNINNGNPTVASATMAGPAGSTLTISALAIGSSTLVISDSVGASISIVVTVSAPGALMSTAPSPLALATGTTSNSFAISGGVGPYTVQSANPALVSAFVMTSGSASYLSITALPGTTGGTANVIVSDANGTQLTIVVNVPAPVALSTVAPNNLYVVASPTAYQYAITGGLAPYSASSSDIAIASAIATGSSLNITAKSAGTATVVVKDSSGLSVTIQVTVGSAVSFFVAAPPTLNMGAGTNSIPIQISGGSKPYSWSTSDSRVVQAQFDPAGSQLTVIAGIVGSATLKITDAVGATYSITVVVDSTGGTGAGAAASIDILASSNELKSAPGSTISFIVTVKNGANAALPNQIVVFTADSGTLTGANPAPVTNAAGTVSTVTLSPGADASNRSIKVTATVGSVLKSIDITVVGTTVSVNGPGAAIVNSPAQTYTLKAADSSGRPIFNAVLQISSDPLLNNSLNKSTVKTDIAGAGTVDFAAVNAGVDTLTVKGLGAENTAKVVVSADNFAFVTTVLTAPPWTVLPTTYPVTVRYLLNGVPPPAPPGLRVDFSTTRGTLSPTFIYTDGAGDATVNVSSTTAGPVTVSAQLTTAAGKLVSTSLTGAFVAKVPATLVLQANPAALPPNAAGSTTNQSALTAIVRDAIGNPVKDAVVNFTVTDSGGGSLSQGSVPTDANGLATTQFIAGPSSTASNGVKLSATVQSTSPAVTGTASLTVNGSALFITIARSGTLDGSDLTTYKKDFTVYLTDATGAPAGNQAVTLSVWPTTYGKGTLTWDNNVTPPVWKLTDGLPTATCANEDGNRNGIIDLPPVVLVAEDINGNQKLDPGMPAVITPSVTTDALGFATFTLRFGKNFAWWVDTEITARALVGGTESTQIQAYPLEMTSTDAHSIGDPANKNSPFGKASVCTDPS